MQILLKLVALVAVVAIAVVTWSQVSQTVQPTDSVQGQRNAGAPGGGRPGRGAPRDALVVSEAATEALVNDRLNAVGSGEAKAAATVVPLSSGTLVDLSVSPGQHVIKGDILARLDDDEQSLARDRAARIAQDAAITESRLAELYKSKSTSASELDNAKAARADADLVLQDAELKLQRRLITAPISGIVGLVSIDPGNYVTAQTDLLTIDDRSTILVKFWVPERFANSISLGQSLTASAVASPGKKLNGMVSEIGSRVETDSRTLPIVATLDNASDTLRPGMSFELQLHFSGDSFPAVNPLAIQWDSQGSYVWRVDDSKAQRVPVTIVQRNPESVLVAGAVNVDDQIITEGTLSLRDGASVRIQGSGPSSGARPSSGTRPDSGVRPSSGTRPSTTSAGPDSVQGSKSAS